jgi:transposase-like protein
MPKSSDFAKLQLWRTRFREFAAGDSTVEAFCRRVGLSPPTFYYWKRRVAPLEKTSAPRPRSRKTAADRSSPTTRSSFLPVIVGASGDATRSVAVTLRSGVQVRVPADAEHLVRELLDRVLERESR